jgi:hypothetical protein
VHRRYANKPVLNTTAAGADISHSYTAHGDPSTSVSAWINLPLIEDKLAVRGVFYDDMRGSYIRNVPGTFSRKPRDQGIVGYFGGVVPPLSGSLANTNLVQDAFNPTTYEGFRTLARYQINDDWSALELLGLRPEALMTRFVRLVHAPAMGDQPIGKFIRPHISRHHLETPFMTGRRIHI